MESGSESKSERSSKTTEQEKTLEKLGIITNIAHHSTIKFQGRKKNGHKKPGGELHQT